MAKIKSAIMWYVAGGIALYWLLLNNSASASTAMISTSQLQQTKNFESFSPTAYPDGSENGQQKYSIGYGHQILPGEDYLMTGSISESQAEGLLQTDLQYYTDIIQNSGLTLTQGQFDALTDFGYNEGPVALQKVLSTFNSSGSNAALTEMQLYVYWHPVPGGPAQISQTLIDRRNAETITFNS